MKVNIKKNQNVYSNLNIVGSRRTKELKNASRTKIHYSSKIKYYTKYFAFKFNCFSDLKFVYVYIGYLMFGSVKISVVFF